MWFVFALITTLLWGAAELFYKKGALEHERYSHLKICVLVGGVMGVHAIVTLLTGPFGFRPIHLLQYAPVSLCYISSMALSFFGMRFIEESISDPIENTSGAICALLCVLFLGQTIAPLSWVAIGLMVAGILGVGFLERRGTTDRRQKIGKTLAVVAFVMPMAYALIDAVGSFLDVFYLELSTTPLSGVTEETIEQVANTAYELTFAIGAVCLLIFMKIKRVPFDLPKQRDKFIAAVCETGGQLTYVFAMSGNGAVAAPMISSVCVVSLLLSRVFLKEKLTGKQYAFIALVLAGILLLSVTEGE